MSEPASRRYGLIGAGHSAHAHVRALNELAGVDLVAVAETDADALNETLAFLQASRFKPAIYSDWREMLQLDDIDAVIIASDSALHFEMLTEAFEINRAIFVETPICGTIKEARQLVKQAAKRGSLVQVGLDCRCLPDLVAFVTNLQDEPDDPPHLVKLSVNGLAHADMATAFKTQYVSGAPLDLLCGPYLDLMAWTAGSEPVRMSVNAGHRHPESKKKRNKKAPMKFDHGLIVLEFANGAKGVLDLTLYGAPHISISAITEHGQHGFQMPALQQELGEGVIANSLQSFDLACATGQLTGAALEDGVRAIELGLAAQQSAISGKPVKL